MKTPEFRYNPDKGLNTERPKSPEVFKRAQNDSERRTSESDKRQRELDEESELKEVRSLIESQPNSLEENKILVQEQDPNITSSEVVKINGQNYTVQYVKKESISPAFGYGGGDTVRVREDLSPRVKAFVKEHELYHSTDKYTWGGWAGREIRANFVPGLKDPVGLLATVSATIFSKERLGLYFDRIRKGY